MQIKYQTGDAPRYLNNIINEWFQRAKKWEPREAYFDRFISLWISFNAWYAHESRKKFDPKMIKWVYSTSRLRSLYKELLFSDKNLKKAVEELEKETEREPVKNMHPAYRRKEPIKIEDITRFDQVMDVIYRVRCNLFHGGKLTNERRDQKLVRLSFKILSKIFGKMLYENFSGG